MLTWRVGAIAAGLVAGVLLFASGGEAIAPADTLAVPASGKATSELKRLDLGRREGECLAKGRGRTSGNIEFDYDRGSRTLRYRVRLEQGEPRTSYLVDIAECGRRGERLARGDGGHFQTDSRGQGEYEGTWAVQTEARWIRATLVSYCGGGADEPPEIPCGPVAFSTDALVPPQ